MVGVVVDNEILRVRAFCLQCIREFFISKGYWEVETPLLAPALIPEACLEVFETRYIPPYPGCQEAENYYLIPSPEVWMKRILAGGSGSIFQLTKCFRNVESRGKYHNPEFTMLEWYSVGHDYRDEMLFTEDLLGFLIRKLQSHDAVTARTGQPSGNRAGASFSGLQECPVDVNALAPPFMRLSMLEAFRQWAHLDLLACNEQPRLYEAARQLELAVNKEDSWEEIFNKIFLTLVEPALPVDKPLILYDYPAQVPTLARENGFSAERWELYIKGVEIANCFTEETDPEKVARFIKQETIRKNSCCRIHHRADTELAAWFGPGYPACSGVALGIDRLLMVLLNLSSIKEIMLSSFTEEYR